MAQRMNSTILLAQLNTVESETFIEMLGDIFEHSAWIPEQTHGFRPFISVSELHARMVQIVKNAPLSDQLNLLRAHPELAGREAIKGTLTKSSASEQSTAGMNSLNPGEMQTVKRLNEQYSNKFGFPFIIAVLDNTKEEIFKKWDERLNSSLEEERETCLEQVYLIAHLRLTALVKG